MANDNVLLLPDAEVTVEINGVQYVFEQYIQRFDFNDPRTMRLLCSSQGGGDGLDQIDNQQTEATINFTLRNVSADFVDTLSKAWKSRTRIKFSAISTSNGRFFSAKQCLIKMNPNNRVIDETDATYDTSIPLGVSPNNTKFESKNL